MERPFLGAVQRFLSGKNGGLGERPRPAYGTPLGIFWGPAVILRILLTGAVLLGLAASANAADTGAKEEAAVPLKHKRAVHKAAPYRQDCCGEGEVYRSVYAEAWYGNQKIVALVRHVGCCDQLQLPTGEWIPCEFSCEITMRKMPLGYWQAQGAGYSNDPRTNHWTDGWGFQHGYLF
jgi:hypothetical protein